MVELNYKARRERVREYQKAYYHERYVNDDEYRQRRQVYSREIKRLRRRQRTNRLRTNYPTYMEIPCDEVLTLVIGMKEMCCDLGEVELWEKCIGMESLGGYKDEVEKCIYLIFLKKEKEKEKGDEWLKGMSMMEYIKKAWCVRERDKLMREGRVMYGS